MLLVDHIDAKALKASGELAILLVRKCFFHLFFARFNVMNRRLSFVHKQDEMQFGRFDHKATLFGC